MATHVPTLALHALAVAVLAICAPGAERADVADQVAALLRSSPTPGATRTEAERVRELVALGAPAVVPLLDELAGCGRSEHPLAGAPRGVAVAALARLSRAEVLAELERRASGDSGARIAVLQVLAEVARPGDCGLALAAAAPAADGASGTWEVQRAFERCLERLLAREPGFLSPLAASIPDAHPSLLWLLVRELGETRTPEAFDALGRELGRAEGAGVLLLDRLRELAPLAPHASLRAVWPAARWGLVSTDRFERLAACRAAAALDDIGAVEGLVGLLGDDDDAVRLAALDALTHLTARQLGPESERWWAWVRAEVAWWRAEGLADLERVRSGGREELPGAVRRLARGRLFRDQLVPELLPLLGREEPDLVRLVASVLGSLGSREAAPELESLLAHAETAVQGSARKALQRLGGGPSATRARPGPQLAARGR